MAETTDFRAVLSHLCFCFLEAVESDTPPSKDQVREWWSYTLRLSPVLGPLISAAEDLIEEAPDDPRIAALRTAVAHANGGETYQFRRDRW